MSPAVRAVCTEMLVSVDVSECFEPVIRNAAGSLKTTRSCRGMRSGVAAVASAGVATSATTTDPGRVCAASGCTTA